MPMIPRFDRDKIILLHQPRGSPKRHYPKTLHFSECLWEKTEETGQMKDKRKRGKPKNVSTADEQYLTSHLFKK